ncbi:DUF502 domain-containing protein [Brevibacillus dissolubilis]|uniref:DUF502 domain-containing protein n=1 Tax=Brevibacillus dissolubilis TaxID=1844116 RepID=UPI001117A471|nr:DUF502 domain-containing protein [Brevibacillus dissolubilis]
MKRILKYFFEGLLFVVPLAATVYILYYVFVTVDGLLRLPIPGLGFLVTILAIILVGMLASNVITRSLLRLIDGIFGRLPFIKLLYTSVKDLIGAFVGEKKSFDKPVLVRLTVDGHGKAVGFITRETMEAWGMEDHVAVYFPQSYNFAGNLLLFPREQVEILDVDSADVMAFLVSGGVSGK